MCSLSERWLLRPSMALPRQLAVLPSPARVPQVSGRGEDGPAQAVQDQGRAHPPIPHAAAQRGRAEAHRREEGAAAAEPTPAYEIMTVWSTDGLACAALLCVAGAGEDPPAGGGAASQGPRVHEQAHQDEEPGGHRRAAQVRAVHEGERRVGSSAHWQQDRLGGLWLT